jgi:hypothetical protein
MNRNSIYDTRNLIAVLVTILGLFMFVIGHTTTPSSYYASKVSAQQQEQKVLLIHNCHSQV